MVTGWRHTPVALVISAGLSLGSALSPATAQQADLKAGVGRLRQYIDTGNYPAAIAEAQNLEATVKTRFGTQHSNYTIALQNLIIAYKAQANNFYIPHRDYAPAAELYERVLAIEEQAKGANHPEVAETAKDTAEELSVVAKSVGAPATDLYLREMASETNVKTVTLANYKVVYFATHGLVAGDVKGLAEPSLALTIPKRPSDRDDGLLTASEIAELKLNADWVVLSACNTIAGEKPGAEALSGLARAFFYAGARALLVSHWKVASDAATRLTTSAFNELALNPKVGRAEALRRSMLSYLNDKSAAQNAYPAFWGPFALIGEGAAR